MMRSTGSLRWAVALALGACAYAGFEVRSARAEGAPGQVRDVRVSTLGEGSAASEVTIVTTGAPKYSARVEAGGKRLLLDLADADVVGAPEAVIDRAGIVAGVLTHAFRDGANVTTRVAITLSETAQYRIRPDGDALRVVLTPADKTEPAPLGARAATDAQAASAASAVQLADVRFTHGTSSDVVSLELSGDAQFATFEAPGSKSRIELRGVRVPKEIERTLDTSAFASAVRSVSTSRIGDKVVVEVEHRPDVVGVVVRRGNALAWTFARPGALSSSETGIASDGGAARKSRTVAREDAIAGLPRIETSIRGDAAGSSSETATAAGETSGFTPPLAAQVGRFTGRRIDLDLKDADIHNVLRLLADVGKINVITADTVNGSVTIRMRNVPWDQALDVVLQSKGLGMVRQGNLVRVATLGELEKEREMAINRRRQELDLAPLETRIVPISYAAADHLVQRAREMLSPRGSIAVDDRTNVLIARDIGGNLNQLEELVRSLDTQTPQVLIEARIVEATSRYLRDVGIQWGGSGTMSAATGNPTGLAFPSTATVAGGASDGATPTAGLSPFDRAVANPNFAVNLPAAVGTGQGGAIGFSFGSINNNIQLALRLSAAEASGMLRVISSPRILTLDNKDARINTGTLLPFSQVSAVGVQTTFQEAKLQLMVKPHVTADGSIAMHVKVNRDEPDFNQTSARGEPTILKREAETDLLVMDGHTAVIGGIYTRNTGRNVDQVPFFGDIPLLGVLFQRRRATDTRGEMVIFITPRIVNRAEALGH